MQPLLLLAIGAIDVIGYYGNSGNAVPAIPKLGDIHGGYNVLIITFASPDAEGGFHLDIQGPYANDRAALAADIARWKAGKDEHGRTRSVLVSVGGQNGGWPDGLPVEKLWAGLEALMRELGLDGLDVDLEGAAVEAAASLAEVARRLVAAGKLCTAAPEAAQSSLSAYLELLPLLSWVHPQFYKCVPSLSFPSRRLSRPQQRPQRRDESFPPQRDALAKALDRERLAGGAIGGELLGRGAGSGGQGCQAQTRAARDAGSGHAAGRREQQRLGLGQAAGAGAGGQGEPRRDVGRCV